MKTRKTKGFTIVELIIVIAVIGILAAILIPTFASIIKKANISSVQSNVKNLNTAIASESIDEKTGAITENMSVEEAMIKVAKAGFNSNTFISDKEDIDVMWSVKYNKFAVVATQTSGTTVTPTDVLFPKEMVDDATAHVGGFSSFLSFAEMQSTSTVSKKSEAKITEYTQEITNGATVLTATTSADLASLAAMSNGLTKADSINGFEGITINIEADMFLGGTTWCPFGEMPETPFKGNINGNGHTIYGLTNLNYDGGYIFTTGGTNTEGECYGLIAYPSGNVTIENLTMENVNIDMKMGLCVGAFVGYSKTDACNLTLTNCHSSGAIKGKNDVGGLIGKYYGGATAETAKALTVTNCSSSIDVTVCYAELQADKIMTTKGGGLLGYTSNYGNVTFENCASTGSVTINDFNEGAKAFAGGLIGGSGTPGRAKVTVKNYTDSCAVKADAAYTAAGAIVGQALNYTTFVGTVSLSGSVTSTGSLVATAAYYFGVNVEGTDKVLFGLTYKGYLKFVEGATINDVALTEDTVVNSTDKTGAAWPANKAFKPVLAVL